jgi:hypothetical protein
MKKYTITHLDVDKKKTVNTVIENSLLEARKFANGLNRQGRFFSLKNNKGVFLPI